MLELLLILILRISFDIVNLPYLPDIYSVLYQI